MKYQLICFDAGFTLIQPRRDMAASLAAIIADEGLTPTEDALRHAWNLADRWFWEEYHRPDNTSWRSDAAIQQTWRQYHALMLRELGVDDHEYRLADAVIASHYTVANWELYSDVLPTLDALHNAQVRLGIVSDWDSNLPSILDGLHIAHYFDFALASAAAGAAKPDPAFYRMALRAAHVEPHQAVMVGDSYRADVLGARAAGMDAVLLDRLGTATTNDVPVVRSLTDILELMQGST
jgi:putative hydrolase of the HAD superfamily